MDYTVIDDFLPQEVFDRYSFLMGSQMPMYYSDHVASQDDNEQFYWHHCFYNQNIPLSQYYEDLVLPLLDKAGGKALISARANWYPRSENIIEHGVHIDSEYPHRNIVFYVNTNNGFTRLHDDDGASVCVDSVANRALLFDGLIKHNSTTCSDKKVRCSMAINYFD